MAASGDYGVANGGPDPHTDGCINRHAKNFTEASSGGVFSPNFPASCPYVLGKQHNRVHVNTVLTKSVAAVGATQLASNQSTERVMSTTTEVVPSGKGTTFASGGYVTDKLIQD